METIQYISDGAMKRVLIDRNPERAVRTDLQYGLLDPAGLAWKIRERGACEPAFGFSMDAAREYMRKAPEGRAAKRAKVIRSLVEWGVYRLDRHSTYEHVGANSTITGVRKNIILRDVTGETPTDEQLDVRLRRLHRALFASADVSMSEADRYEDIY